MFVNLSTEKHLYCQLIVAFEKKRLKNESWKKTKSLAAKKSRISEDFLHLSTENRKFRRYCIFSLFGQWNQSKEFPNQVVLSGSKVHPLKRSIKDRQQICFLFVDWANWKFFFLWKKCFVSQLFFLAFKRTLLNCIVASQKNESKSNNETNFVWAKN